MFKKTAKPQTILQEERKDKLAEAYCQNAAYLEVVSNYVDTLDQELKVINPAMGNFFQGNDKQVVLVYYKTLIRIMTEDILSASRARSGLKGDAWMSAMGCAVGSALLIRDAGVNGPKVKFIASVGVWMLMDIYEVRTEEGASDLIMTAFERLSH